MRCCSCKLTSYRFTGILYFSILPLLSFVDNGYLCHLSSQFYSMSIFRVYYLSSILSGEVDVIHWLHLKVNIAVGNPPCRGHVAMLDCHANMMRSSVEGVRYWRL